MRAQRGPQDSAWTKVGVAVSWLATGTITARTASELQLKIAGAGAGASQLAIIRRGEPASFTEVAPGAYSACVVPYPAEVQGMAAMGYMDRHGDKLPAYCVPAQIASSPGSPDDHGPRRPPAVHPR